MSRRQLEELLRFGAFAPVLTGALAGAVLIALAAWGWRRLRGRVG